MLLPLPLIALLPLFLTQVSHGSGIYCIVSSGHLRSVKVTQVVDFISGCLLLSSHNQYKNMSDKSTSGPQVHRLGLVGQGIVQIDLTLHKYAHVQ